MAELPAAAMAELSAHATSMAEAPAVTMAELSLPVAMPRRRYRFPARLGLDDDCELDFGQSPLEAGTRALPARCAAGEAWEVPSDLERVRETESCATLSSTLASSEKEPSSSPLVLPLDLGSGDLRLDDSDYEDARRSAMQSEEHFQTASSGEAVGFSPGHMQGAEPSYNAQPHSRVASGDALGPFVPSQSPLSGAGSWTSFNIPASEGGSTELHAGAPAAAPAALSPHLWLSGSGTSLTVFLDDAFGQQPQALSNGKANGLFSNAHSEQEASPEPTSGFQPGKPAAQGDLESIAGEGNPSASWNLTSQGPDNLLTDSTLRELSLREAVTNASAVRPTLSTDPESYSGDLALFAGPRSRKSPALSTVLPLLDNPPLSDRLSLAPSGTGRSDNSSSQALSACVPDTLASMWGGEIRGISLAAGMGHLAGRGSAVDSPSLRRLVKRMRCMQQAADGTIGPGMSTTAQPPSNPPEIPSWLAVRGIPPRQEEVLMGRLLCAADALEKKDTDTFQRMCDQLKSCAKPKGQPMERLLHYFLQGLTLRSTGRGAMACAEPLRRKKSEVLEATQWFVRLLPLVPFYSTVQAEILLLHMMGKEKVHVVELGSAMLPRWTEVLRLIAAHPGANPKELTLSLIDLAPLLHPRRRSLKALLSAKWLEERLEQEAKRLNLNFKFQRIELLEARALVGLKKQIRREGEETILFCTSFNLMHIPGTPSQGRETSARDSLLQWAKDLGPAAVISSEIEMDVCGMPFLERVKSCADYYLSFFDANETLIPHAGDRNNLRLYEELFAGSHLINVTSCEGSDLVVQPEILPKLQRRFARAGFSPCTVSADLVHKVSTIAANAHPEWTIILEPGMLGLAWRGRLLVIAGVWN